MNIREISTEQQNEKERRCMCSHYNQVAGSSSHLQLNRHDYLTDLYISQYMHTIH